jgi:hypothetical protein
MLQIRQLYKIKDLIISKYNSNLMSFKIHFYSIQFPLYNHYIMLLTLHFYVVCGHQHMLLHQLVSCNLSNPEYHTRIRINTMNKEIYIDMRINLELVIYVWSLLHCVPSLMYVAQVKIYISCALIRYRLF